MRQDILLHEAEMYVSFGNPKGALLRLLRLNISEARKRRKLARAYRKAARNHREIANNCAKNGRFGAVRWHRNRARKQERFAKSLLARRVPLSLHIDDWHRGSTIGG